MRIGLGIVLQLLCLRCIGVRGHEFVALLVRCMVLVPCMQPGKVDQKPNSAKTVRFMVFLVHLNTSSLRVSTRNGLYKLAQELQI
jgi:hypothetical protein